MRRGTIQAAMLAAWLIGTSAPGAEPDAVTQRPDSPAAPAQRPFETFLPWSLARGEWELSWELAFRREALPAFTASEPGASAFRREQWRLGLLDAALGLGSGGEVQVRLGLQRFEEAGGSEESGIDDARISIGYQVPADRLAVAARLEVKLPNASSQRRLGTDQTDLYLRASAGRLHRRSGWAASLGLGILGSPVEPGVQDDVLLFGAAAWAAPWSGPRAGRLEIAAEVAGQAASRFGNDFRLARLGLRSTGRVGFDLSIRRGLTSSSESWGLETGLTLRPPPLRQPTIRNIRDSAESAENPVAGSSLRGTIP